MSCLNATNHILGQRRGTLSRELSPPQWTSAATDLELTPTMTIRARVHGRTNTKLLPSRPSTHCRDAQPWRVPTARHGQGNYSGRYWSATMRRHLPYESLLELSVLMLADFDDDVIEIYPQPFLLAASVNGCNRTHTPDILVVHASASETLINVKTRAAVQTPGCSRSPRVGPQRLQIDGLDAYPRQRTRPRARVNIRFLTRFRRSIGIDETLRAAIYALTTKFMSIGEVEHLLPQGTDQRVGRAHVLHML